MHLTWPRLDVPELGDIQGACHLLKGEGDRGKTVERNNWAGGGGEQDVKWISKINKKLINK